MGHNSRTVFACHEYLHKTLAPNCFDLSLRIIDDPFSEALKAAGIDYEGTVLDNLKSLNLKFEILDTSLPNKLWEQNTARAMMSPDIEIIYQKAISSASSDQVKADAIKWLREYNRDDVKATFAVREYLRSLDL